MSVKPSAAESMKQSSEKITSAYQKLSGSYLKKADESAKFKIVLLGILFLAGAAYLSLAYNWPKFSRAEVFFAECVREMFQADNLITPLYHGTPFFDKPILAYWFIALSYKIAGISHFTARIPSVIAALGTVAITAFAGRSLFGSRAGTLAAAVLASSLMFISFANLCMSDMNLVLFDTMSLALLYMSLVNEKHRSILLYFGALSMGMAFITKGPVGIVLPAVSFAAFLSISKQWKKIELVKHVIPCALILAGAGIPWFMAAYRQNGAGALSYFFIHENLERFTGSTYDTHRPIWFMIVSFFSGMLPWSLFIPFALSDSIKAMKKGWENIQASQQLYLWLWIAVVLGFFSFSRGKIDYYALPVYPAAALIIGNYLSNACDNKGKVASVLGWVSSGLIFAAGIASIFVLPNMFSTEGFGAWFALPLILISCGSAMLYCAFTAQFRKTYKLLFVSICLLSVAFSFEIYPWITSKQAVLKYIPYIRNLPENSRVGVYTSLQNWIDEITFQTNTEPMKIESPRMAEQFLKATCPSILLIQENEFNQMSENTRSHCQILGSNPFIPRSLNPVYFISKGEKLGDKTKLLLVTNQLNANQLQADTLNTDRH